MSLEGNTIFHRIIRKEIPAKIVYEDEDVLAFHDVNPVAPIHILIIPRSKSITSLADSTSEDTFLLGKMLLVANQLAHDLGLSEQGFRVVTNSGEQAGQSVFHFHLHLLGGRPFTWPPG